MKSIVLIGPESTGKTQLAQQLATAFNTSWAPEYLREYVDKYNSLQQEKLTIVAERQIENENNVLKLHKDVIFLDTNIVTNKIYYEYYYEETPLWFNRLYNPERYDHYLLLDTTVPWVADPQRDSPEAREKLYSVFHHELKTLAVDYTIITGTYHQRFLQAKRVVTTLLQNN